jgi:hypothetical protein
MVRNNVVINNEIIREPRNNPIKKFVGKNEDLIKAVEEVIRKWIKEES